jgi:hypothetical protein
VGFIVVDVDGSSNLSWPVYNLSNRTIETCDSEEVEASNDAAWLPDCEIRQSILDVGSALTFCAGYTTGWVVLVEDDCIACPGAVDEIVSALSGLNAASTARFSKASRGTAFPVRRLTAYVDHIVSRRRTVSYDIHDPREWYGEGSAYVHRRNLLHHVGFVSTSYHKNSAEFHIMYDALRGDSCFDLLA